MKINAIELRNFGCIQNFKKEFNRPLVILAGDNGMGKSTVLKSILLNLFDTYDGKLEDFINWDATEFYNSIRFTHKGVEYVSTVLYNGSSDRTLAFNDELYRGDEAKRKLKQIMDVNLLKAAMLALEQQIDIVTTRPAERREFLKRIYDLEFKQQLADLNEELEQAKQEQTAKGSEISEIENRNYIEFVKPEPMEEEEEEENYKQQEQSIATKVADLKAKGEQHSQASITIFEMDTAIAREKQELEKLSESISNIEKILDGIPLETQEQKTLLTAKIAKNQEEFDKAVQDLAENSAKYDTEIATVRSKVKRLSAYKSDKLDAAMTEMAVVSGELASLQKESDVCSRCGQPITSPEHKEKRLKRIDELTVKKAELEKVYQAEKAVKEEHEKAVKENEEYLALIAKKEKDKLVQEKVLTENKTKAENEKEKAKTELLNIETIAESRISSCKDKIALYSEKLKFCSDKIDNCTAKKEEALKVYDPELPNKVASLVKEHDGIKAILETYSSYRGSLKTYEEQKAKVDAQKAADVGLLVERRKEYQIISEMVADLTAEIKILKTDFPVFTISRAVKEIEKRMNAFIEKTYQGRYVVQVTDKKNALYIVYGPKDQDVALSSGYEKSIFNLAFKVAISHAIGNKSLLLDEADSAASDQNSKIFYTVLGDSVGQFFEQIILISHKEATRDLLETLYDAETITFYKGQAQA